WVVDLVCHRCRQPSRSGQFLCSKQQVLLSLTIINVDGCAKPVRDPAHRIDERLRSREHPAVTAVPPPHTMLDLVWPFCAKGIDEHCSGPFAIFGVDQIRAAQRLAAWTGIHLPAGKT